jgi:hypothetical protein
MKTQFITDAKGEKLAVVLPIKDYEKILEKLEELEDIKAYDKAKSRKETFVPAEDKFKANDEKRKGS